MKETSTLRTLRKKAPLILPALKPNNKFKWRQRIKPLGNSGQSQNISKIKKNQGISTMSIYAQTGLTVQNFLDAGQFNTIENLVFTNVNVNRHKLDASDQG